MKNKMLSMLVMLAITVAASAQSANQTRPGLTTARATQQTQTAFTLTNGKLGPVSIGIRYATLPKKHNGLYDSFKYTKEEMGDDMDSWIEEWCHFYKGGREIFRCFVDDGKLISIVLLPGSEFIKTGEGFHVGYNARELYRKKTMQWETYFEGESFGTSGHYTYYISSDDVANNETPNRVTDIKAAAKLMKIVYQ